MRHSNELSIVRYYRNSFFPSNFNFWRYCHLIISHTINFIQQFNEMCNGVSTKTSTLCIGSFECYLIYIYRLSVCPSVEF